MIAPPEIQCNKFERIHFPYIFDPSDERRRTKPKTRIRRQLMRCPFHLEHAKSCITRYIIDLREKVKKGEEIPIDKQLEMLAIIHDDLIGVYEEFNYLAEELTEFLKSVKDKK